MAQKSNFKGDSTVKDFDSNPINNKTQTNRSTCMKQVFWSCL